MSAAPDPDQGDAHQEAGEPGASQEPAELSNGSPGGPKADSQQDVLKALERLQQQLETAVLPQIDSLPALVEAQAQARSSQDALEAAKAAAEDVRQQLGESRRLCEEAEAERCAQQLLTATAELALATLQAEVAALQQERDHLLQERAVLANQQASWASDRAALESEVGALQQEREQLQAELLTRPEFLSPPPPTNAALEQELEDARDEAELLRLQLLHLQEEFELHLSLAEDQQGPGALLTADVAALAPWEPALPQQALDTINANRGRLLTAP